MNRSQLLAAEVYGYSYDHYHDHLEDRHPRFRKFMPDDMKIIERAELEDWDDARLATALEIKNTEVGKLRQAFREALQIVDAPTPAESFRRGVRVSIVHAVANGLTDVNEIEQLVTQICYRAADLGYLLDQYRKRLSDYSVDLRDESTDDEQPVEVSE